jgi:hypothetical protein
VVFKCGNVPVSVLECVLNSIVFFKGIMLLILVILLKVFCVESKYIPSKHEYKTLFVKIGLKKTCIFVVFCVQLVSQHH